MTLNSTSMARPPPTVINLTAGHAQMGGVKHQMKPTCQPSAGVEHNGCCPHCDNFFTSSRARPAGAPGGQPWPGSEPGARAHRRGARERAGGPPPGGRKGHSSLAGGSLARRLKRGSASARAAAATRSAPHPLAGSPRRHALPVAVAARANRAVLPRRAP
jgi:hypothetical protein